VTGGFTGVKSMRGLKFGSTSTTPIFGTLGEGLARRGPLEPRRNRALRDGITVPAPGAPDEYGGGGADDSGWGGSSSSSVTGTRAGGGASAGGPEMDAGAASPRSFTL